MKHSVGLAIALFVTHTALGGSTDQMSIVPRVTRAAAIVQLVPGEPRVTVVVSNRSQVPLEAWSVQLTYDLGGGPQSVDFATDASLSAALEPQEGRGPIPPGRDRRKVVPLDGVAVSAQVVLQYVVFSDLSTEGPTHQTAEIFQVRDQQAAALKGWLDAFAAADNKPVAAAKGLLRAAENATRAKLKERPDIPTGGFLQSVSRLLDAPDAEFVQQLAGIRSVFERQYQIAIRHRK